MGLLIDGVWHGLEPPRTSREGYFLRAESAFRNWVTPNGRPGPTGHDGFVAARGRYHLYVSLACPWAQRTLIMRVLKGLEEIVSVAVTHWRMGENGWSFEAAEGVIADPVFSARYLHEIYSNADPSYTGRVTVPVLWDRHTQSIVNNESTDIIRMFNSGFDGVGANTADFYPAALRPAIDDWNARIQATVNEGVYRAGFAATAAAHTEAVEALFATLDTLEAHLAGSRFLCGEQLTEADIRLFPTLLRFDAVYYDLFRCRKKHLADYRHLWDYTRDIYQWPGVAATVNMRHIRGHYYESLIALNPAGTVPETGLPDFDAPADRGKDISRLLTF
jgi:glutathionyl-hydroquinone reductase